MTATKTRERGGENSPDTRKVKILHPFLFIAYPPLFLLSRNLDRIPINLVLLTILAAIPLTFLFLFICKIILKSWTKSGLLVSLCLAWFLLYSNFFEWGKGFKLGNTLIWRHKYTLSLWTLVFVLAAFFILRKRSPYDNLTRILNLVQPHSSSFVS